MALIVLSHQLGAGGPEIGLALSQRLGYRYVDQELLQDAGLRYGLAEEKLSHLDESKPTRRGEAVAPRRVEAVVLRAVRYRDAPPHHGAADDPARVGRARQRGADARRRPVAPPRRAARAARAPHRAVRASREAVDQAPGGDDVRELQPAGRLPAGAQRRQRKGRADALPLRGG